MGRWRGLKLYGTIALAMMVVRQDYWQWSDRTLLFGVLPVGLAYQAGFSVLAALVMWALVRWDWPVELQALEESDDEGPRPTSSR